MRKILNVLTSVKSIDILLVSAWVHGGLLYYISTIFRLMTGNELLGSIVFFIYYTCLVFASYRHWIRKIRGKDIGLIVILALIVLLSYAFNTANQLNILENSKQLFVQVIPFYFVGLLLGSHKKRFDLLYLGSLAAVIVNWLYVFLILGTGRQMQEDNLAISYSVLPHVLMLIWYALEKKNLKTIMAAVCGSIFIFVMGSRGPVLSCVVFAIVYYLTSTRCSKRKKIAVVTSLLIVVFIVVGTGFLETMLLWLREIIVAMNLSTRVIDDVLYNSAIGSDEERRRIYSILIQNISEHPLVGYGIYGEWNMINYSAHQMVLELWVHYGVVTGTIILLWSLFTMFTGYKKSPNHYAKIFVLLMVSFGVVRGIYAGSYLSYYIFMLMGYCVSNIRRYKRYELDRRLSNDV